MKRFILASILARVDCKPDNGAVQVGVLPWVHQ